MPMDQDPLLHLRQQIESGRLPNHSKLPPERVLAEQYGISRTVVRKTLAILEAEGKIRRHVGRGTFVGSAPGSAGIWSASPSELIELRLFLEPRLAGAAALRATPEDIDTLRHCLTKFETASEWETHQLWDYTLHQAIAVASHNSLVVQVMEEISELRKLKNWDRLQKLIMNESRKQVVARSHRGIVEAITDRDPKRATMAMRDHLLSVEKILRDATGDLLEDG